MKHSFDTKCRELAEYFYPDWDAEALDDLAQDIQTLVEDATIKPPLTDEPDLNPQYPGHQHRWSYWNERAVKRGTAAQICFECGAVRIAGAKAIAEQKAILAFCDNHTGPDCKNAQSDPTEVQR